MQKEEALNPRIAGLTLGVLWGAVFFLWTLVSLYTGYSKEVLGIVAGVYPGYAVSYTGSILGAIYGFVDGFIAGFLVVWLYNKFSASVRIRKTLRTA